LARPRKQTVDYFPHSVNHGKTIFILEQKFGNDGYAFWFKLLEILGSTEGHFIDLNNPADWEFLTSKTHTTDETAEEILNLLAKLQAIDPEAWKQKIVWCDNFIENIKDAYRNRKEETPEKPNFLRKKPQQEEVSTGELQQKTTKESKVNNNRVQYKDIYDYYISLDLIKHRQYTGDMKKAIETAMKNNNYTVEYCKTLLDRHKKVVEATKNSEYPVRPRGLAEFFGQKVNGAKHLICSEYEEGGIKYEKYINNPQQDKPKAPLEGYKTAEQVRKERKERLERQGMT